MPTQLSSTTPIVYHKVHLKSLACSHSLADGRLVGENQSSFGVRHQAAHLVNCVPGQHHHHLHWIAAVTQSSWGRQRIVLQLRRGRRQGTVKDWNDQDRWWKHLDAVGKENGDHIASSETSLNQRAGKGFHLSWSRSVTCSGRWHR